MYLLLYGLDHEVTLAVPLQGWAPQAATTAAKPLRGWRWTRFVASAAWTSRWSSGWNPTLMKSMLTWTSSLSTWPPEPRMDWSSSPLPMNSWESCRSSDNNHCHHHRWMNGSGSQWQAQWQSVSSPASPHLVSRWGCRCNDNYHCHHHRWMKQWHAQWGSSISIITKAQDSVTATHACLCQCYWPCSWTSNVTEYELDLVTLHNKWYTMAIAMLMYDLELEILQNVTLNSVLQHLTLKW